jgi:hypothetical protein
MDANEMTAYAWTWSGRGGSARGLSTPGMKARVQRGRKRRKQALLDCCDVTLDPRGGVTGYQLRSGQTSPCRAAAPSGKPWQCS